MKEHYPIFTTVFSHLLTLQFTEFTHPFVIVCFEVFQREIRGTVPFANKCLTFLSLTEMGVGMGTNVPSKLRGCAAAQLVRKRRAAVSNCRAASSDHYVNFIYL